MQTASAPVKNGFTPADQAVEGIGPLDLSVVQEHSRRLYWESLSLGSGERLSFKSVALLGLFLFFVLIIVGTILPIVVFRLGADFLTQTNTSWSILANIGGMYGVATALLGSAALIAAIYAIYLQYKSMKPLIHQTKVLAVDLQLTGLAHRVALAANISMPLITELQDSENSGARKFVAFYIRQHLKNALNSKHPGTDLEDYRRRFQNGEIDAGTDPVWQETIRTACSNFQDLRLGNLNSISVENIVGQFDYEKVQDKIRRCSRVAEKLYALWQVGVIGSDQSGIDLAKTVLTPDVVALLQFQYRPLAMVQVSETSRKTLSAVDFAVSLYADEGLRNFSTENEVSYVPREVFQSSRV